MPMDALELVSAANIDDLSEYKDGYSTIYLLPVLSMKKFVYKILLFTALVILCAFGFDSFLSWRLRNHENRMYAAWNQVYNSNLDYILGSQVKFIPKFFITFISLRSIMYVE